MKELIANAYAKINWCLDITGRRKDGYHLLDMLMQPVFVWTLPAEEKTDIIFWTC